MINLLIRIKNKELFIALYFLFFILGGSTPISLNFYNEARVLEILLLLGLSFYSVFHNNIFFDKKEYLFLTFLILSFFFLQNYQFIFFEILLFYLLYKAFFSLKYNEFLSKLIVWSSLFVFLMLPIAIVEYINSGTYQNWYPMPWNIRIYNSYFLIFSIFSIFSIWFYLQEVKYKNIYLVFIFLAFLSILLDGGRSATLAYTAFIVFICIFNSVARFKLLLVYITTWLTYFFIVYLSNYSNSNLISITRESTSGRYKLWVNALQCWMESPFWGCGFYQLNQYSNLPAHPHNLFIQVLTETGLIGFSFLAFIMFSIIKNINWNFKQNYFVLAVFSAVSIDLFFSGVHVYPITQVALLWLFVFLLKNPEFQHATYFNRSTVQSSILVQVLNFIIYFIFTLAFIYLFINTSVLSKILASTPPRFWEYGYQLF